MIEIEIFAYLAFLQPAADRTDSLFHGCKAKVAPMGLS
jgi:hypothetical protein